MKKIAALTGLCLLCTSVLGGCGEKEEPLPDVALSVWCASEDLELMNMMIASFREEYGSEANFSFTVSEEGEDSCKDTLLANVSAAPDVFSFVDDQFNDLCRAEVLMEITEGADEIIEQSGGADSGAIAASTANGRLYAIPSTASNGYFLYYSKEFYSDEDIGSFDSLLDIAEKNGKKVVMDMTSGWYLYSFFKGAGLDVGLNDDMMTNYCSWNATDTDITGVDVVEGINDIVSHPAFLNDANNALTDGLKDGSVIAAVNGTWNAKNVEDAFGENYAAAQLPTYTVKGQQVQMHSFAGYKLLGIRADTKEPEWALKFARWITNEENETLRYIQRGEGPANVRAAASEEVQSDPAIAALTAQSKFSHRQNVASTYWTPTNFLGVNILAGSAEGNAIQPMLNTVTQQITALPEEAAE